MLMWPTFMVVDEQGGNTEIFNILKMSSHGVLYAPKCYGQQDVIFVVICEVFFVQVFLSFAFDLCHEGFFLL